MFGGMDEHGKPQGDLYLIRPNYYENSQLITEQGQYKRKTVPHIQFTYEKLIT